MQIFVVADTEIQGTFEKFYQEFQSLSLFLLSKQFEQRNSYLDAIYFAFLDKLVTTYTKSAEINNKGDGPSTLISYLF